MCCDFSSLCMRMRLYCYATHITFQKYFLNTFELFAEAVDDLMAETHELGGSTVVVDRATPKVAFRIMFSPNYIMKYSLAAPRPICMGHILYDLFYDMPVNINS